MENNIRICRLCLQVTYEFERLDDVKFKMLKTLLVNLNIFVSKDPLICTECFSKLQQSFDFKLRCLDYMIPNRNSRMPINLDTIITNRNIAEDCIKVEELYVCKFCLNYYIIDKLISLQNLEADMFLKDLIDRCLPEIDFSVINNPLVCLDCMELLQLYFNFMVLCCDSDEIISYIVEHYIEDINSAVDLFNVVEYVTEIKKENSYDLEYLEWKGNVKEFITVKKEKTEQSFLYKREYGIGYDVNLEKDIKIETNPIKIEDKDCNVIKKEDKLNNNLHLEQIKKEVRQEHEMIPKYIHYLMNAQNILSCPHCPHWTNRKDSMDLHLIVHEKCTEIIMYKCSLCSFQSKWKSSLRLHLYLHKPRDDLVTYKCANCSYQSIYKKHLRRHMKRHTQKTYTCDVCSFESILIGDVRKHYRLDHNLKPSKISKKPYVKSVDDSPKEIHRVKSVSVWRYVCPECQYETKKIDRIKEHFLKHQSDDEVIMHKCKLCTFKSKYKASLRHHMKLHDKKNTNTKQKPRRKIK